MLVDVKGTNLYLPLDKMLQKTPSQPEHDVLETSPSSVTTPLAAPKKTTESLVRILPRGREERGRE